MLLLVYRSCECVVGNMYRSGPCHAGHSQECCSGNTMTRYACSRLVHRSVLIGSASAGYGGEELCWPVHLVATENHLEINCPAPLPLPVSATTLEKRFRHHKQS